MTLAIRRRRTDPADTDAPAQGPATRPRRLETFTAGSAAAAASTTLWLARLIRLAAAGVAIVIGIAILLALVAANPHNSIVSDFHDAGRTLAWVFKGMFTIKHHPDATLALNWGIAAVVYLVAGGLLAQLIAWSRPRRRATRTTVVA